MCKLTKTFGQQHPSGNTTTLNIQVDYDPSSNEVTEILHVYAYDCDQKVFIDITEIMMNDFWLERKVEEVDWALEYREMKEDKRAA
jgi:hypothetical protein